MSGFHGLGEFPACKELREHVVVRIKHQRFADRGPYPALPDTKQLRMSFGSSIPIRLRSSTTAGLSNHAIDTSEGGKRGDSVLGQAGWCPPTTKRSSLL